MFIDSHCHISSEEFNADREETVQRAHEMKVEYMLNVCADIDDWAVTEEFSRNHKGVYTSVGIHPENADKYKDFSAEELVKHSTSPYVVGIGECGLDYYYNSDTREAQLKMLEEHIKASQQTGLPLIIHNRNSDEDMIDILSEHYKKCKFTGELHCFSSSEKLGEFALKIGFYLSASGIITFKNSENLRNMFKEIPNNRLLIETDSPFLAPIPHRGKRNEPAFVVNTAQVLADLKHISIAELAEITGNNFFNLFSKAKRNV